MTFKAPFSFSKAAGLLALLLFLLSPTLAAQNVLDPTGKWVTDNANMLSPEEEQLLSLKLASYSDTTSTQIVIVSLPDLGGNDAMMYAVELGRKWKVGQAGKNNGVVILISREDRQIAIATGYGLEGAITDYDASSIRRNIMVPQFRQGHYYQGLSDATDALIAAARGEYKAEETSRGTPRRGVDMTTLLVVGIILYFVVSSFFGGRRGGKGGRGGRRRGLGIPPVIIFGGGGGWGSGGGFGGGFGGGGGGFGGFGGGGGSFGGGGASGSW